MIGPQPHSRALDGRLGERHPLARLERGELDDQDRILRREPDQGHEPDLEEDVVLEPAQEYGKQRAEHGERHREDHRERQRPALVLRREHQEHHQHADQEHGRRAAAGHALLVRGARPGQLVALGQRLGRHLLHRCDRLARAEPGRRAAEHLGRREHVEALDDLGPGHLAHRHERRQRDQLARAAADVHVADVVGPRPELRIRLQVHAEDAPVTVEVVDVERAEGALQRVEHVGDVHAEQLRLLAVRDRRASAARSPRRSS